MAIWLDYIRFRVDKWEKSERGALPLTPTFLLASLSMCRHQICCSTRVDDPLEAAVRGSAGVFIAMPPALPSQKNAGHHSHAYNRVTLSSHRLVRSDRMHGQLSPQHLC